MDDRRLDALNRARYDELEAYSIASARRVCKLYLAGMIDAAYAEFCTDPLAGPLDRAAWEAAAVTLAPAWAAHERERS